MRKKADTAVLPHVERMLTSIAVKRVAESKRRRGRGTTLMIIAFAGLALAGTALAATGVWNPLGGGGHSVVAPPSQSSSVAEPSARPEASGLALAARPHESSHNPSKAIEPQAEITMPPELEGPVVNDGAPDAGADGAAALGGGGSVAPSGGDSPKSQAPGAKSEGSDQVVGGRGPQAQGPGPEEGKSKEQPGEAKPVVPNGQASLVCLPGAVEAGQAVSCRATVSGEAGVPSGTVLFKAATGGTFSSESCVLGDDGNGTSSSCGVTYTPSAGGADQITAYYGGDANNAAVASNFVLEVL